MSDQAADPKDVDQGSGNLPCTITMMSGSPVVPSIERERSTEMLLRLALADSEARLRQKDEFIQRQELLSKESDHRLMNDLQMIISLLSLQSRGSTNAEAAAQLAIAANRVSMIARIHHRLHCHDGVQAIAFLKFLEDFGHDFSAMLGSDECPDQVVVDGVGVNLPAAIAIPLGFIVSELVTNAAKYGSGRIFIGLRPNPEYGYALSISNDGPDLPEGFDLDGGKGLGMKIIRSFAKQIGGELRAGRADDGHGARFTVLFSGVAADAVSAAPDPGTAAALAS
jgi:two-component sensor histidine kinase